MITKDSIQRIELGLLGLVLVGFIIFGVTIFSGEIKLWNTDNIQPELTGNPALDQETVHGAKQHNDTLFLFGSMVLASMIYILHKSFKSIGEGLQDIFNRKRGK